MVHRHSSRPPPNRKAENRRIRIIFTRGSHFLICVLQEPRLQRDGVGQQVAGRERVGEPSGRAQPGVIVGHRVGQRPHDAGQEGFEPGGKQAAGERPGGPLAEFGRRLADDQARVEAEPSGQFLGELDPVHHLGAGDMDQARMACFDQPDDRPGDVRAVARVRDLVARAFQRLAGREGPGELIGEVLALTLRAEDPGRPDGELAVAQRPGQGVLGLQLRLPVGREGVGRRVLRVRAAVAVEHVVGRERDEPRPDFGRRPGEVQGLLDVGRPGPGRVALAAVDPGEAGRVEDDVGLLVADPGRRDGQVGGVEVDQAGVGDGGIGADGFMASIGQGPQEPAADLARATDDDGSHRHQWNPFRRCLL